MSRSRHGFVALCFTAVAVGACIAPLVLPFGQAVWRVGSFAWICAILACGLHVVTGLTRVISLCHFGLAGVGAYTAGCLSKSLGMAPAASVLCGTMTAGLFALLLCLFTSRLADHYLTLATLAANEILNNVFRGATEVTGGANGLFGVPPLGGWGVELDKPSEYYPVVSAVALITLAGVRAVDGSVFGHALRATGDLGERTASLGVGETRLRAGGFVLGGLLAGLAGSITAHIDGFVGPDGFGIAPSVFYLCFIVLAGVGRMRGVLVTAAGAVIAAELLRDLKSWQMVVLSVVTLGAMLLRGRTLFRRRAGGRK